MRANIRIKFRKIAFLSLIFKRLYGFSRKNAPESVDFSRSGRPNDKSRNRHRAPRAGQPQPCRPVRTVPIKSTVCRSLRPVSGCVTRCLTLSAVPIPRSYRPRAALSSVPDTEYSGFCIRIEGRLLDTLRAHHGHLADGTRRYNAQPYRAPSEYGPPKSISAGSEPELFRTPKNQPERGTCCAPTLSYFTSLPS